MAKDPPGVKGRVGEQCGKLLMDWWLREVPVEARGVRFHKISGL